MATDPTTLPANRPWERLPDEPPRAWSAFQLYRDMQARERSIDAVGRVLYPSRGDQKGRVRGSTGRLREWSTTYCWRERSAAFDRYLDAEALTARREAIVEANRRHALQSRAFINKVIQRWATVDPATLTPGECIRIFGQAMSYERTALGQPLQLPEERNRDASPGHTPHVDSSPAGLIQARVYSPSPEFVAEVMKILDACGANDVPEDAESSSQGTRDHAADQ